LQNRWQTAGQVTLPPAIDGAGAREQHSNDHAPSAALVQEQEHMGSQAFVGIDTPTNFLK
jgi:hypothetical protein